VVETHPGLRITGPASVRDGQRLRQSFDEFITVRHDRTFERMLRTLQLGPTPALMADETRRAQTDAQVVPRL
jgi:hypothetical protein